MFIKSGLKTYAGAKTRVEAGVNAPSSKLLSLEQQVLSSLKVNIQACKAVQLQHLGDSQTLIVTLTFY